MKPWQDRSQMARNLGYLMRKHDDESLTDFEGDALRLADAVRINWDSGDHYGSTMNVWFAICGELNYRGEDIPDGWNYQPGVGSGQRSEDWNEDLYDIGAYDLEVIGNLMATSYRLCNRSGLDY